MTLTWRELPDPRRHGRDGAICRVQVAARVLRKIARKHVRDQARAWEDWIGKELRGRLLELVDTSDGSIDQGVLDELAAALEADSRRCLEAPLLIRSHSRVDRPRISQWENWYLALPSGALLVVTVDRQGTRVSTCFFRDEAGDLETPRQRCRALQGWLLARQCRLESGELVVRDAGTPLRVFSPDLKQGGAQRAEDRHPLAFVSCENWGVDPGPPMALRRERAAYTYPEPSPDGAPPQRPRRKLPPRYKPEVEPVP